jgi:protocatechuate 3,4-dioxygenase beta subunit
MSIDRRELMRKGVIGLAAAGVAGLALRSDAQPTPETEDAHDYLSYVDVAKPSIQPAQKWAPSHEDILGPYYLPGTPFRGKVTAPLEPGSPLVMAGRVWSFTTGKPITNAVLDVWQADNNGQYDMVDPRNPPKKEQFRNRIRLVTDETGYYEFETIKPSPYKLDPNGNRYRPAHIHYLVQAPGHNRLITQLYFAGDKYLESDPWASKSDLIVDLETTKVAGGSYTHGVFDIVLSGA